MRLTRQHHMRSTVALLLVVLVSTSPGAMTLLAAPNAAPTAAHHHAPSDSQRHHHHLPADCCCGLCVASCIACGGTAQRDQVAIRSTVADHLPDPAGNDEHAVDASPSYRLPPPIGPPN